MPQPVCLQAPLVNLTIRIDGPRSAQGGGEGRCLRLLSPSHLRLFGSDLGKDEENER